MSSSQSSGVGLGQLLGQRIQIRQVGEGSGAIAQPEALVAFESLAPTPVQVRTQRLQVGVHASHLLHQLRASERLVGQFLQFPALISRHRVEQSLGRRGARGEGIEQFVQIGGVLGKEVAVFGHELGEVSCGVDAAGTLVEQVVEVAQHLVDGRAILIRGVLKGPLHPANR